MTPTVRYGTLAIAIHWVMAALILFQIPLGLIMVDLPKDSEDQLSTVIQAFNLHKSIGALILMIAAFRLLWRLFHPAPPLPAGMPRWQVGVAHATHWLLYLAFFAVPLSGWTMSSAHARTVSFFGLFDLPNLVGPSKPLAETLESIHVFAAYALAAVVVIHIGAALQHFLINRDTVLSRMLPFAKWPAK